MRGWLALSVVLLISCSGRIDEDVSTQMEPLASIGTMGAACAVDVDCPAEMGCTSDHACLCRPGLVACHGRCVDVAGDPRHCGGCNTVCPAGLECDRGLCGKHPAPLPYEIDGASAGSNCVEASEGYPERSINNPGDLDMPFQVACPAGHTCSLPAFPYNHGTAWNSWQACYPSFSVGIDSSIGVVTSDSWATTSGNTQREYVSIIATPSGTTNSCIGIADISESNLNGGTCAVPGTWNDQVKCATTAHTGIADGPSVNYDIGGSNLFAVENNAPPAPPATGGDKTIRLDIFKACGAGSPGNSTACPITTADHCVQGSVAGCDDANDAVEHATVTVNPCTHHAIVGYRNPATGKVSLAFYDANGTKITGSPFTVATTNLAQTSACSFDSLHLEDKIPRCGGSGTDCGDTTGCMRLASKVHVAPKYRSTNGHCYALVAFDSSCASGTPSATHMRSNFGVVDLGSSTTTEFATGYPSVVASYISAACNTSNNQDDFGSISTASGYTQAVGWFYYHQPSDPCHTYFVGWTDTDTGLTSMTALPSAIAGPFQRCDSMRQSGWVTTSELSNAAFPVAIYSRLGRNLSRLPIPV